MEACNYLFYWIAFATLIYVLHRFDFADRCTFFIAFSCISFVRYFANHIAGSVVMGFQPINSFFKDDLPYILIDIFMDLFIMWIGVGIVLSILKKHSFPQKEDRFSDLAAHLPTVRLFDLRKTLAKSTLLVAIVPSAFHMLSRVIFDFNRGAPTGLADLLWIITGYLMDALSVLIGYVVMLFLINRTYLSESKGREIADS